jgi:hypothetical protein
MHHELPARLDLDWYRKEAKRLVRAHREGRPDARERAADVLGPRAQERFRLSDAQHVIAVEHGHGSWAAFARSVEDAAPEPPVGRIGPGDPAEYEARARELVEQMASGDEAALRRVRAHVPRLRGASEDELRGRALPLRDARLVVAREYGFPTWRLLVHYVRKARADWEAEQEARRSSRPRTTSMSASTWPPASTASSWCRCCSRPAQIGRASRSGA